ncbi:hypothetical protein DL93DRAFT_2086782 [Clavulina sp. PMI_390]|nr:hypothetical protein DL93DRAFT_2086782 [Clavulina sp. PMI_390]
MEGTPFDACIVTNARPSDPSLSYRINWSCPPKTSDILHVELSSRKRTHHHPQRRSGTEFAIRVSGGTLVRPRQWGRGMISSLSPPIRLLQSERKSCLSSSCTAYPCYHAQRSIVS